MDNILILANHNFAKIKKKMIKIAKLIIKNYKYLIFVQPIKIKLNLNSTILRKKSYIAGIFLIIDYDTVFIA